jgi:hypothetical protein
MARRCSLNGLLLAGLIVTLIGLAVGLRATLDLPDHWTTLAVGVALLIAGALRAVVGRRRPDSSSPGPS